MAAENVPADLTITGDLASTAVGLMALVAPSLGPVPRGADERRKYGYRLAHEAAALAGAISRPTDALIYYLAQVRASHEKAPMKGILREVELTDRGPDRPGAQASQKVKLTFEATAAGQYSSVGDIEVVYSDFTNKVGFGDFFEKARALIGRECIFRKYLEDTQGRGKGPTAIVVVSIEAVGGHAAQPAPGAQPPAEAPTAAAQPAAAPPAAEAPAAVQAPPSPAAAAPPAEPPAVDPAIVAAREVKPTTKKEIVQAAIAHLGFTQETAAEECKRIALVLKVDIKAPSAEDITNMWTRMVTERAATLIGAAA